VLKGIVIDDESAAIKQLEKSAVLNGNIQIIAGFTNPEEGLVNIKKFRPDIVFLDINMPEISGLYLAEQIVKFSEHTSIIFVTSFNDYALKAFELNALDYLLKPLTQERFDQCIRKILKYGPKTISQQNINLVNSGFRESAKKIFVDNGEETILIKPEDIYFFEVNNKIVLIHTQNGKYTSPSSLDYFESKLQNSNFFRCHRSFLVNLDKVYKLFFYSKNNCEIGFSNIKDTVMVSKRNIHILKKLLEY